MVIDFPEAVGRDAVDELLMFGNDEGYVRRSEGYRFIWDEYQRLQFPGYARNWLGGSHPPGRPFDAEEIQIITGYTTQFAVGASYQQGWDNTLSPTAYGMEQFNYLSFSFITSEPTAYNPVYKTIYSTELDDYTIKSFFGAAFSTDYTTLPTEDLGYLTPLGTLTPTTSGGSTFTTTSYAWVHTGYNSAQFTIYSIGDTFVGYYYELIP